MKIRVILTIENNEENYLEQAESIGINLTTFLVGLSEEIIGDLQFQDNGTTKFEIEHIEIIE